MDEIAILDFGGQYAHLICNRIRRLGVHAVVKTHDISAEELKNMKGIIFSGGPQSVNAKESLKADLKIFELGIPILGICYGHQLTSSMLGGKVSTGKTKEYGNTKLIIDRREGLFEGIDQKELQVWMSHWDEVTEIPVDFEVLAHTDINDFAAVGNLKKNIFGIQFHPEVTHTEMGMKIFENFVSLTGAKKSWNMKQYLDALKEEIDSSKKVFMLVSGGVDSVVAFTLLNKVLGETKVKGLLIDTGFMRKGEIKEVSEALDKLGVHNLHVMDAKEKFYRALEVISDPEEKRRIIGKVFLEVQAQAVRELGLDPEHWILGQGTIYPDTIESGGTKHADTIKTHHNRVPEIQQLIEQGKIIEPLKDLYKDEVRELGELLGLPHHVVHRHPFPGPGLAIRILCSSPSSFQPQVTNSEVPAINDFLRTSHLRGEILLIRSVGVQGDVRTYRHPLAIFPEDESSWEKYWNPEKLATLSTELTNRFSSINRVIFCLGSPNLVPSQGEEYKPTSSLSPDRIAFLQEADSIVMKNIEDLPEIWQCPTVLLPGSALVVRPITSIDAMTASVYFLPLPRLKKIIQELEKLQPSTIYYDLTSKPPGTIEWE